MIIYASFSATPDTAATIVADSVKQQDAPDLTMTYLQGSLPENGLSRREGSAYIHQLDTMDAAAVDTADALMFDGVPGWVPDYNDVDVSPDELADPDIDFKFQPYGVEETDDLYLEQLNADGDPVHGDVEYTIHLYGEDAVTGHQTMLVTLQGTHEADVAWDDVLDTVTPYVEPG